MDSGKLLMLALLTWPTCGAQVPSFNADIATLVYEHCAPCHHPGGIGPFPLLTYNDVSRHASQIVDVTRRRYMPPWPPQAGFGDFVGERRLTDQQIEQIAAWVKAGKPKGDPQSIPKAPSFGNGWQLGAPDLVLRMERPFQVQPSSTDVFRNFIIKPGLKDTKYVRALELRISDPQAVHHANVLLDRTRSLRHRDGEDGRPGFPGMDVTTEASSSEFDPDSHFLFWKPGSLPLTEPGNRSWRLDPETDLVVNLHLQPSGKRESILAEVGLYFGSQAPTQHPMLVQLEHDGAINIPPGDPSFVVSDELTLPINADLLAIYPHAHYLGKLIECWATLPDGSRVWLIRIPDWDLNWQAVYEYRKPVRLPSGTRIAMRIFYDNSSTNPRNPKSPPVRARAGNRGEDEMGHVWLQLLPAPASSGGKDPRLSLQEAVMRRRLQKYPKDFLAYYNLAAVMQAEGQLSEAERLYRSALDVEPSNKTARNSLATALLLEGRAPEAIGEFRSILEADPGYTNAHYNLAQALASAGDAAEAEGEFRRFLRERPDDANANASLAGLYISEKSYAAAIPYLQKASALEPENADLQADLGTALALTGQLPAAIAAFEQALMIDPNQPTAKANLARARTALARSRPGNGR